MQVRVLRQVDATGGTSGNLFVPANCIALIYAIGGGGGAASSHVDGVNYGSGGGGGGGLFKNQRLTLGQRISYSAGGAGIGTGNALGADGSDGGESTITLPDGRVLIAGGGKKGTYGFAAQLGGAGGVAFGGDVNRAGGSGGNSGAAGASPGAGGGAGGPTSGAKQGGGGGGAGFGEIGSSLAGGPGGNGTSGATGGNASGFGGGGGVGTNSGGHGSPGRVIIWLLQPY